MNMSAGKYRDPRGSLWRMLSILLSLLLVGCPDGTARLATSSNAATASGLHMGQVLGLTGKPVAGVLVQAYLVSNNSGNLISNNSGSLVSNNTGAYRVQAAGLQTRTDADGNFNFTAPEGAILNVEAVLSDDLKAIALGVPAESHGLNLPLTYTGAITGRITVPDQPQVTNLQGVDVYVPGTSYLAKTDAAGLFALPNVPVGSFTLVASRIGLGSASKSGVTVTSRVTTQADDLALSQKLPAIATVVPDHGAPGATITITGDNFGTSTGEILQLSFPQALATQVQRLDDHTLKVVVPDGATSGKLVINVGGVMNTGPSFSVLASLVVEPGNAWLLPGSTRSYEVTAVDTRGQTVEHPHVNWSLSGEAAEFHDGLVTGRTVGDAHLQATNGKLRSQRTLHVIARYPTVTTRFLNATESIHASGLLWQPDHSLVIADFSSQRLLRFDLTTAALTVLAGSGMPDPKDGSGIEASFGYFGAPGRDPVTGDLYVPEMVRNVLRKVTPDGTVTTLGSGEEGYLDGPLATARFYGPYAVLVDESQTLWIADKYNHCIRKIADGIVSTFAGSEQPGTADGVRKAARFGAPSSLARDLSGNLYVSDDSNHNIRKITPDGTVTTLAGSAAGAAGYFDGTGTEARFDMPRGLAVDAQGRLLVADTVNRRIRMVEPDGTVTTLAGNPLNGVLEDGPAHLIKLSWPSTVVTDPAGRIFVYDSVPDRLMELLP